MNKSFNIALIEDSQLWTEIIKFQLREFRKLNIVLTCQWGEEFYERFNQYPIDLVLLDISLPGTNGFEVAKEIKRRLPNVPIVVFSSSANSKDIYWAL
jgi:DNA-binding NarL/FixJ family response regulator